MTENKGSIHRNWVDPDDAPDLSAPEWQAKLDAAPVKIGRPRLADPKERITIRLDADLVREMRATGKGWQSRVNEALRREYMG